MEERTKTIFSWYFLTYFPVISFHLMLYEGISYHLMFLTKFVFKGGNCMFQTNCYLLLNDVMRYQVMSIHISSSNSNKYLQFLLWNTGIWSIPNKYQHAEIKWMALVDLVMINAEMLTNIPFNLIKLKIWTMILNWSTDYSHNLCLLWKI